MLKIKIFAGLLMCFFFGVFFSARLFLRDDYYAIYRGADKNVFINYNKGINIRRPADKYISGYEPLVHITDVGICGIDTKTPDHMEYDSIDDAFIAPGVDSKVSYRGYDFEFSLYKDSFVGFNVKNDRLHTANVFLKGELQKRYIYDEDVGVISFEIFDSNGFLSANYTLVRGTGLLKECRPSAFIRVYKNLRSRFSFG